MDIWTDGACSGNPGAGGWAVLYKIAGREKRISGGDAHTTNNRMELLAVIEALQNLPRPMSVNMHVDSAYVMNAITKGWLASWQKKGWQTTSGPVKNRDLWEMIVPLLEIHEVTFHKVKGHSGHIENDIVDEMAVEQRDYYKAQTKD